MYNGHQQQENRIVQKATEVTEVIAALKHEKIYWKSHKYKIAFHLFIEYLIFFLSFSNLHEVNNSTSSNWQWSRQHIER